MVFFEISYLLVSDKKKYWKIMVWNFFKYKFMIVYWILIWKFKLFIYFINIISKS